MSRSKQRKAGRSSAPPTRSPQQADEVAVWRRQLEQARARLTEDDHPLSRSKQRKAGRSSAPPTRPPQQADEVVVPRRHIERARAWLTQDPHVLQTRKVRQVIAWLGYLLRARSEDSHRAERAAQGRPECATRSACFAQDHDEGEVSGSVVPSQQPRRLRKGGG
jgi:hypothetical protein